MSAITDPESEDLLLEFVLEDHFARRELDEEPVPVVEPPTGSRWPGVLLAAAGLMVVLVAGWLSWTPTTTVAQDPERTVGELVAALDDAKERDLAVAGLVRKGQLAVPALLARVGAAVENGSGDPALEPALEALRRLALAGHPVPVATVREHFRASFAAFERWSNEEWKSGVPVRFLESLFAASLLGDPQPVRDVILLRTMELHRALGVPNKDLEPALLLVIRSTRTTARPPADADPWEWAIESGLSFERCGRLLRAIETARGAPEKHVKWLLQCVDDAKVEGGWSGPFRLERQHVQRWVAPTAARLLLRVPDMAGDVAAHRALWRWGDVTEQRAAYLALRGTDGIGPADRDLVMAHAAHPWAPLAYEAVVALGQIAGEEDTEIRGLLGRLSKSPARSVAAAAQAALRGLR